VLQWARARGCPCDGGTCARAASGGYLEVLQWAVEHDCEMNAGTCQLAAQAGGVLRITSRTAIGA